MDKWNNMRSNHLQLKVFGELKFGLDETKHKELQ